MATLPPRSGDAPNGAPAAPTQGTPPAPMLPDEAALHRLFEAEFPPLVDSASRELGAAAALAPRVVESAFVHAWEQRARFETPAGLQAFLRDDVHHGVARTLSRRAAAHRLGHHGEAEHATAAGAMPGGAAVAAPPVDTEVAWMHVLHTIHDQGPKHEARAHAIEQTRHDAAQHVASIGAKRTWWPVVVAAVIALVAIVVAMQWADRASQQSAIARALAAQDTRLASSGRGQQANVTLGDGTRVRLAPDTRVTIPKEFGPKFRAVALEGAATFEPTAGDANAFQVHTHNVIVVATGTKFSVRSWQGDDAVGVLVHEGTVAVRVGDTERTLSANQALVVRPDGAMDTPDEPTRKMLMGWTDGRVVLPQQPLEKVLPLLQRWWDLDVGLADPSLGSRPVSIDAPLASAKEAVAAIEQQARVKYSYAGRELVFRDAGDAAAVKP
jgi:ferric-dicitrate binding protein FerR (iron transport regulator)